MADAAFLAVDWGTTNLRAWTVGRDGAPLQHWEAPLGVGRLPPGGAAQAFREQVRPALDAHALPALLSGMIGSTLGWVEVPYLPCPADAETLARGLRRIEGEGAPVWIVPGLKGPGVAGTDVMRGEETQIIGWLAEDPARRQGRRIVCHPGTHAKWARIEDGRIARFNTVMTGELFDVLSRHSVLRTGPDAQDSDEAFEAGLTAAGDGSALAARLFSARSRVVSGEMPGAWANSYLSGLLIGAEAACAPALLGADPDEPVAVVGDPRLQRLYRRALERAGRKVQTYSGDAASLSGLNALWREVGGTA